MQVSRLRGSHVKAGVTDLLKSIILRTFLLTVVADPVRYAGLHLVIFAFKQPDQHLGIDSADNTVSCCSCSCAQTCAIVADVNQEEGKIPACHSGFVQLQGPASF